jgi:hypothetical protein
METTKSLKSQSQELFKNLAGHRWLMHIILAIQEAEIRKIVVQSQPGQIVHVDPILQNPSQKGWWSASKCRP